MNNMKLKKGATFGVILLLIGLAVVPTIYANTTKEAVESELVEITTELCGIKGVKPHTVKLTQEQTGELDALFDSIKERLDKAETREETVEIFNEAIVELDKYGLLGGLSVKQAQKMVTGRFQNSRFMKLIEKIYNKPQGTSEVDNNTNCLIAGYTNKTGIFPGLFPLWMELFPFEKLLLLLIIFAQFRPFYLFPGALIEIIEGTGWVYTIGMNGIKSWKGTLIGRYEEANKWAVLGFSGLNILLDFNDWYLNRHFYLGFAWQVIIEELD